MGKSDSSSVYDVIVIGAGLSGLISAAVLAKQGLKVLVVEKNSYPGGSCSSFSKNGHTFDIGPSLFWGLDKGEYLHNLLSYLGIEEKTSRVVLNRIEPGLQVVIPGHRVNIHSERARFFEELGREFPESVENLKVFYDDIDAFSSDLFERSNRYPFNLKTEDSIETPQPGGFFSVCIRKIKRAVKPKDLKSYFRRFQWDSAFKDFFDLQTMFFGQLDSFDALLPFLATALTVPPKGVYSPKGGSGQFAKLLAKRILELGGEIRYDTKVLKIVFEKRRAAGIRYDRGNVSKDVFAKKIIAGISVFNLMEGLIPEERLRGSLKRKVKRVKKKWTLFSLFLSVDDKVVPEPIKENLLMQRRPGETSDEKRMLLVNTSQKGDKRAPDGRRAIKITAFLPIDDWKGDEESLIKRHTEEIINDLKEVIPFIEGNFDIVDTLTPARIEELFKRPQGMTGNLEGEYKKGKFGFYGLSPRPLFKNLYLVGENTYPGYGANNAMVSGFRAAQRIIEALK